MLVAIDLEHTLCQEDSLQGNLFSVNNALLTPNSPLSLIKFYLLGLDLRQPFYVRHFEDQIIKFFEFVFSLNFLIEIISFLIALKNFLKLPFLSFLTKIQALSQSSIIETIYLFV